MANRLVEIISTQAKRYGDREAYRFCWRKDGEWLPTSWNEFKTQVEVSGKALAGMGLLEKDTIAICSPNTPQITVSSSLNSSSSFLKTTILRIAPGCFFQ